MPKYWMDLSELEGNKTSEEHQNGFLKTSRRDFLKLFGFGISSAVWAACQKTPVKYALPYINKPPELMPGKANWYASTFFDGEHYAAVLVKTREGRPIKIEGNPSSSITKGGVSARGQASVLSLYDNARIRKPYKGKQPTTWENADKTIIQQLQTIKEKGGQIRILTGTILSPSTKQIIKEFAEVYPNTQWIVYDAVSYAALRDAHETVFGVKAIPRYYFDKADVIVSVACDFLGTWLSPVEFAKGYAQGRKLHKRPDKTMSRHYQFEGLYSMTGANADYRGKVQAGHEIALLTYLYNQIAKQTGNPVLPEVTGNFDKKLVEKAAKDLLKAQGKSIVVCGLNDKTAQLLTLQINRLLQNYGSTLDLRNPCLLRQGDDQAMENLIQEMEQGKVDVLFIFGCNPAYTYPERERFISALKKVGLSVSFADRIDETAQYCHYTLPHPHYLEAWGDAQPYQYHYSLQQPTIHPLFDTRPFQESLLKWQGKEQDYLSYLKTFWEQDIYPLSDKTLPFDRFWVRCLHDGVFELPIPEESPQPKENVDVVAEVSAALSQYKPPQGLSLVLYEKVSIGDGTMANNPWLQELPDPMTRVVWDNYVLVAPSLAKQKGWKKGSIVELQVGDKKVKAPVFVMPGQEKNTLGIALGYGRTRAAGDKKKNVAGNTGVDVYPFVKKKDGYLQYQVSGVQIKGIGGYYKLAQIQIQPTAANRESVIKEGTLAAYKTNPKALNKRMIDPKFLKENDLYSPHPTSGIRWAMVIDMNACIGCGACVVSCIAENNIPVVGKDEIARGRDMHWIRIDRYFSSRSDDPKQPEEENPQVVFQPMLCQHCQHAPCENVCPVLATTHSSEGLNQQAYNRCFGTRYCANNCPHKVRRFNWFNYAYSNWYGENPKERFPHNPAADELGRLVLNPDVTVRASGTMEKCTFCVQRLQAAKLKAKMEGRPLKDGEAKTACQQSCPTDAIIFGNLKDENSEVAKYFGPERYDRSYFVIEEVKTYPSIAYMLKVRNQDENKA